MFGFLSPSGQWTFDRIFLSIAFIRRSDEFILALTEWVSSGGGLVVACDAKLIYFGKHHTVNSFVEQLGMTFFYDAWRGPDMEVLANRAGKAHIGKQWNMLHVHFKYQWKFLLQYTHLKWFSAKTIM